jgi:hypothetical protein
MVELLVSPQKDAQTKTRNPLLIASQKTIQVKNNTRNFKRSNFSSVEKSTPDHHHKHYNIRILQP